jgi:very-short-patch-repair endonuclease
MRDRARAMRREPTLAERRLWSRIKAGQLGGMRFRRQVPLGPYIADFACFDPKVVIECDGDQHAGNAYDEIRDAWLQAQGFRVIRLWNVDVLENLDGVGETILLRLGRR